MTEILDHLAQLPQERRLYALMELPAHLAVIGDRQRFTRLLSEFSFLQGKLNELGPFPLVADYDLLTVDSKSGTETASSILRLIQGALRLSTHVLSRDKAQLTSQVVGRLGRYSRHEIKHLAEQARRSRMEPSLRLKTPTLISPDGPLKRTLEGHLWVVAAVAVTPDGTLAVSASWDTTLKIWDLNSGRELRTLTGHSDRVVGVAVTPDGKHAISASWDLTLRVWDLRTGSEVHNLMSYDYDGSPRAVAVTPDGRRAISACEDGKLRVWDLKTRQRVATLSGHSIKANAVAVTPDGVHTVSASEDGSVIVWNLSTKRAVLRLKYPTGAVHALAVTPDGERIISGHADYRLQVWDMRTGNVVRTLGGPDSIIGGGILSVAVLPDGQRAISSSAEGKMTLWDLRTGTALRVLECYADAVIVSPTGDQVVCASHETLQVWDLAATAVQMVEAHQGSVRALAVTWDNKYAVSASSDHTLKVWDLRSGKLLRTLQGHAAAVLAVAAIPKRQILSASEDGTLKVWDIEIGNTVRTLEAGRGSLDAAAATPDGLQAVAAYRDGAAAVWDLMTGKLLRSFDVKGQGRCVDALATTPDGNHIITAYRYGDRRMMVWDLTTGRAVRILGRRSLTESGVVDAMTVTSDGAEIIYTVRGAATIWDLRTGKTKRNLNSDCGPIQSSALTADGRETMWTSRDKRLVLLDLDNGQELVSFSADFRITAYAVAPDGRTIVAGDESGNVHLLSHEFTMSNKTSGPT